ncbi:hypothetical protein XELAEV_18008529mg [Xenopus laevis]|uniref:Uncharacterized protein n=1 Tax=Xenopus laevis TaxID=8355 RepID=A0A974E2S7_XENLA|nr:hypothetical protein XELAEV_18008529mg [Xenopus laevis]
MASECHKEFSGLSPFDRPPRIAYKKAQSIRDRLVKADVGPEKITRQLKDRGGEHKSDIRRGVRQSPVAEHFVEAGHSISQLRFQVLQQVPRPRRGGDRVKLLLKCEAGWIRRLDTVGQIH